MLWRPPRKRLNWTTASAEAHTSLAFATFYGSFDAAGAEREFQRALALNPNDARAHHWYATFLYAEGRYPEALSQIELAQQLDPASTAILADKGLIVLYAGPREEGVALLKQLEKTEPAFPSTYRYLQDAAIMNKDYSAYLEAHGKERRDYHRTSANSRSSRPQRKVLPAANARACSRACWRNKRSYTPKDACRRMTWPQRMVCWETSRRHLSISRGLTTITNRA